MNAEPAMEALEHRVAPIEMSPDDFRAAGHEMVDAIAEFLRSLPDRPVSPGESPAGVRDLLGRGSMPEIVTRLGREVDARLRPDSLK